MSLTQAIFKPSKELKPNTIYFLKYSDQTENAVREMVQFNRERKETEKVYWKTTDKKSMVDLNSNLNFEFEKTEVVEIETNKKTIYYIKEWNGKLNVGHGMCSGAFTFNRKGKYKVRFTPMNTDGKSLKTIDWKTFESPFMNDKSPFGF